VSLADANDEKWRRRELNEQVSSSNDLSAHDLEKTSPPPTAIWECAGGGECHRLAPNGCPEYLLRAWPRLPPHITETIFTLVDVALSQSQ